MTWPAIRNKIGQVARQDVSVGGACDSSDADGVVGVNRLMAGGVVIACACACV